MSSRSARVGILGSYGGMNVGDEAILGAILRVLRTAAPIEITVYSHDPADTLRRHGVERAVDPQRLSRAESRALARELDLLVFGGGGILYDAVAESYLRHVQAAQDVGTPVAIYAVGVGPLSDREAQRAVRAACERAVLVSVRDRHSHKLLDDLGVQRELLLTADPALLTEAEPEAWEAIRTVECVDERKTVVVLSVREPGPAAPELNVEQYHALIANAGDFLVERLDAELLFCPFERASDTRHCHAVLAHMRHAQRASVLRHDYRAGELLALFSHCQLALGMRLHFLICAALAGVPFVPLPYAPKVSGFLEQLQLPAASLHELSAGRLIAILDRAWHERAATRARVAARLPALQALAREDASRLLALVEKVKS